MKKNESEIVWMIKKRKNKRLLMGLCLTPLLATSAIAIPFVLTSCTKKTNSNTKVGQIKFETTVNKAQTRKGDVPTTLEVLDPNFNENALMDAEKTFKSKLNVSNLQRDFDEVLTKFYKTYEFEYEKDSNKSKLDSDLEVEAEIERIEVLSIDTSNLTATLKVTYDVEVDGKEEFEGYRRQIKPLKLIPKFATTTEIESIKAMLLAKGDIDDGDNTNSFEADVDDLIELYMGDDDDKSIFGQVGLITQESKYGGLLGYEIRISDLKFNPSEFGTGLKLVNKPLTGDEDLFAPSSVIRDFYIPTESIVTSQNIDLTIDYNKITKYTKTQVKSITKAIKDETVTPSPEKNTEITLNDILLKELTKEQASIIESVSVIDAENTNDLLINVTIKNSDEDPMPSIVVIGVDGNWLKSETPSTSINI